MEISNKILVVENDPNFGSMLQKYLSRDDFEVTLAKNGIEGFEKFKKDSYSICILDMMMSYKDGYTLAKTIRRKNKEVTIIFLIAKFMKEDALKGYKAGEDHYLNTPFDAKVLLMKIKAIIQRKVIDIEIDEPKFEFRIGKFNFNSKLRALNFPGNEPVRLTPKETKLLKMLALHGCELMPRDLALTKIWRVDNYFTARSMDVYITRLRKHLKPDKNIEILNIHSEGFKLVFENAD